MKMPDGPHRGKEVRDCPRDYLAGLLLPGVRLSPRLRAAVEDAVVPDLPECLGPRWWYIQRAVEEARKREAA
jgi:hypothetical protein